MSAKTDRGSIIIYHQDRQKMICFAGYRLFPGSPLKITFTLPGQGFKHRFFQHLVWGGQTPEKQVRARHQSGTNPGPPGLSYQKPLKEI